MNAAKTSAGTSPHGSLPETSDARVTRGAAADPHEATRPNADIPIRRTSAPELGYRGVRHTVTAPAPRAAARRADSNAHVRMAESLRTATGTLAGRETS